MLTESSEHKETLLISMPVVIIVQEFGNIEAPMYARLRHFFSTIYTRFETTSCFHGFTFFLDYYSKFVQYVIFVCEKGILSTILVGIAALGESISSTFCCVYENLG